MLRRNPTRAEEMAKTRISKLQSIGKKNCYLRGHPGASASKALEAAKERLKKLKLEKIKDEGGILTIES
ncbi:MAG TPA: IS1634 family transposase, partial [Candidatus Brocadiaceae bacterium]